VERGLLRDQEVIHGKPEHTNAGLSAQNGAGFSLSDEDRKLV
jgi:hypothetical protein